MTEHPTGWRKSSRSAKQTNCVEVGQVGEAAAVRDSKDRDAGFFVVPDARWRSFVAGVKSGRFDV